MAETGNLKVHLALVHHPVYNKGGEVVVSSVTTLDIHDIARICRTFEVDGFYMVTPLKSQKELVERVVEHWKTGYGAAYNPTRTQALGPTRTARSLDEAIVDIHARTGETPRTVIPDAKPYPESVDYPAMRRVLAAGGSYLLVFGTGWGLEQSILAKADFILSPIEGVSGYNHLPVRAAAAIILDRLLAR